MADVTLEGHTGEDAEAVLELREGYSPLTADNGVQKKVYEEGSGDAPSAGKEIIGESSLCVRALSQGRRSLSSIGRCPATWPWIRSALHGLLGGREEVRLVRRP
jgi:hypothetical protein